MDIHISLERKKKKRICLLNCVNDCGVGLYIFMPFFYLPSIPIFCLLDTQSSGSTRFFNCLSEAIGSGADMFCSRSGDQGGQGFISCIKAT